MKKKILIVCGIVLFLVIGIIVITCLGSNKKTNLSKSETTSVEEVSDINIILGTIANEETDKDDLNESSVEETSDSESENSSAIIKYSILEDETTTTQKVIKKNTKKKTIKKGLVTTTHKVETTSKYVSTKKTTPVKTKTQPTKPQVKALGSYSESNVLSSSKVSVIRNSLLSSLHGNTISEKSSLARYMSAKYLSNATATYKSLTNGNKSFSAKIASTTIESDSSENILKAANSLVSKIGGVSGSYGLGVSSFKQNVGFKIYVVVVY